MPRKKRYRGHFCKVCARILANETFSGKGHAVHICKACAKKPREKQAEEIALQCIDFKDDDFTLEHGTVPLLDDG
jgi:hypothetical protein